MILESGIRIFVSHRRLFESDRNRYFVGTVEGYEGGIARVTGYSWARDPYSGAFARKPGLRTKILAIASGTLILYQLPASVDPAAAEIVQRGTDVVFCSPDGFEMDLTEGAATGGGMAPPQRGARAS